MQQPDERKERERAFHDGRFASARARPADRFYAITSGSAERYHRRIHSGIRGMRVLEYGCGPGSAAFDLAHSGAEVFGIDISPVAIELAQDEARRRAVSVDLRVMDAERLEFSSAFFDRVCGSGILHHLDLEKAYSEIARVLTPIGSATFLEPLGHNPLINAYRNRTPEQRTSDEHPLVMSDFSKAKRYFKSVRVSYHHLATLAALPLARSKAVKPFSKMLDQIDRVTFATIKPLSRFAWLCVMTLAEPRSV